MLRTGAARLVNGYHRFVIEEGGGGGAHFIHPWPGAIHPRAASGEQVQVGPKGSQRVGECSTKARWLQCRASGAVFFFV